MIIDSELRKANKLIDGSKIYIDGTFYPHLLSSIRTLPLLINKSLIYMNKNNPEFSKLKNISEDLIEEGIVVPVAISEDNLPDNFNYKKCIIRNKILDESLFTIEYRKMLEEDYDNDELKEHIMKSFKISNKKFNSAYSEMVYSLNWDVVITQVLQSPMLLNRSTQDILLFKCREVMESCYLSVKNINDVKSFISKINPVLPANLSIDKIKEFRRERINIKFRNWLEKSILNAYENANYDSINVDEFLVKEFNDLSNSYAEKSKLVGFTFSAMLGSALGSSFGSPTTGAIVGPIIENVGGNPMASMFKHIWKAKGPNPWVFILADM